MPTAQRRRSSDSASQRLALGEGRRVMASFVVASLLHSGLLLAAYLHPPPLRSRRSQPLVMEIIQRFNPLPEKPPEKPPEPLPPEVKQPAAQTPQPVRTLPRQLQPVSRVPDKSDPQSPALVVPLQPDLPPETSRPVLPKGPIDLFPKNLGVIVGAPAAGAPIPKAPDRLLKDERLEEKKDPPFEMVPQKDGSFRVNSKNLYAVLTKEGNIKFSDRFPIGVQHGGTFTFDLADLLTKAKGQDPHYAERRRLMEWVRPKQEELRKTALAENTEKSMTRLSDQLLGIWTSGRSATSRRRELYEKWADCSDAGEGEDRLGKKARRAIEDFIHTHLPVGSRDAFTEAELDQIASERSGRPPFSPYRTSP